MNTCLIVEDNQLIVEIWTKSLKPLGFEIWTCDNLVDAKRLCNKIPPPDLMLLDLRLVDAHDIDTIQAIKEFKNANPDLIVIVISGYLNPDLIELAMKQGADDVKEKNVMVNRQNLWKMIQTVLSKAPKNPTKQMKFTADLIEKLANVN